MANVWTRLLGRNSHARDVEQAVSALCAIAVPRGLPVALAVYSDGTRTVVGIAASRTKAPVPAGADYAEACAALRGIASNLGQFASPERGVWWAVVGPR